MKTDIKELIEFSKTLKVLYVEDNEEARKQTLKLLENFFVDIVVAIDGKDGLEKFKQSEFDIIFSDINMPSLNGVEMLSSIRELDEYTPFIIISAQDEIAYFIDTIRLGVDGYILKPIELTQFSGLLYKTIEKIKIKNETKNYTKELELKVEQRTAQLTNKLNFDDMTNLMSRHALLEKLAISKDLPVVFLIDIDSLRTYNELFGIEVGNDIIKQFAKLLIDYTKDSDYLVYRVNGDEFAIYESVEFIDLVKYEETIEGLLDFFSKNKLYIQSIDEYIEVGITIGISLGNEKAFSKAHTALHEAKDKGKKYSTYKLSIDKVKQLKNNLYWKKEIKNAIKEDRVEPYFQPIVDRNQNIIKYESLMRIKQYSENGEEKIVSPFNFLDMAIQSKQYDNLSYKMIEKAMTCMSEKNISFSINLDYRDIYNHKLINMLKNKLEKFNKKSDKKIVLEILEDQQIKDYESFSKKLKQFKMLGALIAIDDFGSGFSSLSHIVGIEPDYVKIDASLIKDINTNQNSKKVVQSIVQLASSLGIKTIAEYISSKEIFDTVYGLGVDEFQGYYFGKPVSIDKVKGNR